MRKGRALAAMITFAVCMMAGAGIGIQSCNSSDGTKAGTLQKISHKTGMCNYYEVEMAYEGGRVISTGENSSSYSNSQRFEVSKACYDTLVGYIGTRVAFEYEKRRGVMCAPTGIIISIRSLRGGNN